RQLCGDILAAHGPLNSPPRWWRQAEAIVLLGGGALLHLHHLRHAARRVRPAAPALRHLRGRASVCELGWPAVDDARAAAGAPPARAATGRRSTCTPRTAHG